MLVHNTSVKQLLAVEETLLTEVAVEDREDDQEHPDHQDHPKLVIPVHFIPHFTSVRLERAEVGAFQDPFSYIGDFLNLI